MNDRRETARQTQIRQSWDRQVRTGRLRWLLDFYSRDLTTDLREGERLDLEIDILAFAGVYVNSRLINARIEQKDALELQEHGVNGLRQLFRGRRWHLIDSTQMSVAIDAPAGPVRPPADKQNDCVQDDFVFRLWRPVTHVYTETAPTVMSLFKLESSRLIVLGQDKIFSCAWCGRFFEPETGQQRFCGKAHTAMALAFRNKRLKERPPRETIRGLEAKSTCATWPRNGRIYPGSATSPASCWAVVGSSSVTAPTLAGRPTRANGRQPARRERVGPLSPDDSVDRHCP